MATTSTRSHPSSKTCSRASSPPALPSSPFVSDARPSSCSPPWPSTTTSLTGPSRRTTATTQRHTSKSTAMPSKPVDSNSQSVSSKADPFSTFGE